MSEIALQAVELTRLTNPGPFGIRTPELGEYFGYFDSGRLIALAGERMCAGDLHEVSGRCGRGRGGLGANGSCKQQAERKRESDRHGLKVARKSEASSPRVRPL